MSSATVAGSASSVIWELELSIRGMTCAVCAARVEKKLNAMDDIPATVNFATEKATVTVPTSVAVEQLIEEIDQAGYGAEAFGWPTACGCGDTEPGRRTAGAGCGPSMTDRREPRVRARPSLGIR
jgi:copper chaperone CopZ